MGSQILPLIHNELAKAVRSRLPYFGLLGVGVLCLLIYAVADHVGPADTTNAWAYAALSMQLVFTDIGLIFVIVFSAMLIAEERATGTIRTAMTAPVARWEFFLAKAVTGLSYMLALWGVTLVLSLVLAAVQYPFGGVVDSLGVVYSSGTVFAGFLLACLLSWIPLGAVAMYALLVSTLVRSPGAAVAVGIGTLYLVDFTKHVVGLDPYLWTRYVGYPWQILQQMAQGVECQWQPEVWRMIGLSSVYGFGAFGLGLALFVRQDLK
jgi:ABC-type transport system involved in multi-copper enzyme maturation permease subunit